jgi:Flp pilus assembly protein TadG
MGNMMQHLRARDKEKGSTLVEFSLAVVAILIVLFGIIDIGRALYAYNWLSDAARRATRYAMVRGSKCSGLGTGCPAYSPDIQNYVTSLADGIDTSQLTVTSQCFAPGTARPGMPPCAAPGWVKVTVQYQFHLLSPVMAPINNWNMHSDSQRTVQQ